MYEGTLLTGGALLPVVVDQFGSPQVGKVAGKVAANPLKLSGATPPESEFSKLQVADQKVTGPVAL
jgi:hypothetical protein